MNFLATGEKIRTLRKRMGMRQQELEDLNITRAFISMIETGKRGLSKDTAKILAYKLNCKAKIVGLDLFIDEEYLLRTPGEDAKIYCYDKLNNFPTNDELDVIIDIARTYGLVMVEAAAYKIMGDWNFTNKSYVQAFINYMISLDLYKETDEKVVLPYLYYKLGMCKYEQLQYVEAISLFNRAEYYSELCHNKNIKKSSLYSIAVAYKFLKNYIECIAYAEEYLSLCDKAIDINEYISANILKAEGLAYIGNDVKATLIIEELLKTLSVDSSQFSWWIYKDIGELYLRHGDLEKSLEYFELAEPLVSDMDNLDMSCVYIKKAKAYLEMKAFEDAQKFLNKSIRLAGDEESLIVEAYYILIELYSKQKDFNNLKNTYIKLLDLLKEKDFYSNEVIKLYNKLALLYLEQNDIEMCKKYLYMVC